MSIVEVRDHALWIKHIHGNEALQEDLHALQGGELVELSVEGVHGYWKKMEDGRDGRPTPGIKPIGPARDHWRALIASNRGALVPIAATERPCAKAPAAPKLVTTTRKPVHVPSDALGKVMSAIRSGSA